MASRKRIVLCYILLQASFWGMISSICAYQAAIVLDRGFTTGQAGIFCALCYLASLITQPVIGGWADRHPSVPIKQPLIVMLLLLCFFQIYALTALVTLYVLSGPVMALFRKFHTAVAPSNP